MWTLRVRLQLATPAGSNDATARVCVLILTAALTCTGVSCKRAQTTARPAEPEPEAPAAEETSERPAPQRLTHLDAWTKRHSQEVLAAWYEVPLLSLAKRRAGLEEFSAANNRLPIGTLVRVTHLANGKSVRVRITDRGIHDKRVKLDVCKEAAEELGMLGKGLARVRMEVLDESGGSPPDSAAVAAQP